MLDDFPETFATGAMLLSVRVGAALRLTPFFGGAPMPVLPWLGLSLSLGILLMTYSGGAGATDIDSAKLIPG